MQCFEAGFGVSGLVASFLQAATPSMLIIVNIMSHFITFAPTMGLYQEV
jgi:hypothetical protein